MNVLAAPVVRGVVGERADLEVRAWAVDPLARRSGPAELVVHDGVLESLRWLDDGAGIDDRGVVVAPGFLDLHAHLREPGNESAETIATGLAAAAHGGFTAVCAMPNTTPPVDSASAVRASLAAAAASGSPVRLLPVGAATAGRSGERLAPLGELADAGAVGFSDDGAPIESVELFRNALAYAGMLGVPLIDHPEDLAQTSGAEAHDGLIATVLGLRGWPTAAEANTVARDIAILAEVVRDVPTARLHLTHLSTADALDHVRRASSCSPASWSSTPEPSRRSRVVDETITSSAPPSAMIRAAAWTATPRASSAASSTAPVCTPTRIGSSSDRAATAIARAHRTARSGRSKTTSMPSPVVLISRPRKTLSCSRMRAWWCARRSRQAWSPISRAMAVDATMSVSTTVTTASSPIPSGVIAHPLALAQSSVTNGSSPITHASWPAGIS
jgi:hypothetical protein